MKQYPTHDIVCVAAGGPSKDANPMTFGKYTHHVAITNLEIVVEWFWLHEFYCSKMFLPNFVLFPIDNIRFLFKNCFSSNHYNDCLYSVSMELILRSLDREESFTRLSSLDLVWSVKLHFALPPVTSLGQVVHIQQDSAMILNFSLFTHDLP